MLQFLDGMNALLPRAMKRLAGHKMEGVRTCFRTYCECGWSSLPHWQRGEAYGEWRDHVRAHGGEWESRVDHLKRENRYRRKLGLEEVR